MIALASQSQLEAAEAPVNGRVCIFLPALLGGGAERAMVNLAAGFVRRGVPVDMVLGIVKGPTSRNSTKPFASCRCMPSGRSRSLGPFALSRARSAQSG